MTVFRKRKRKNDGEISLDEIFLDSENLPSFDREMFEGRLEKKIGVTAFSFLFVGFLLIALILLSRIGYLEIVKGNEFALRASNNHLRTKVLFPKRGLIYDRKGRLLAWNSPVYEVVLKKENSSSDALQRFLAEFRKENESRFIFDEGDFIIINFLNWEEANKIYRKWSKFLKLEIKSASLRDYSDRKGLAHILGYVGYPSKEELKGKNSNLAQLMIGKEGVEKEYESVLKGKLGLEIMEVDSQNRINSRSILKPSLNGKDLKLTIDSKIQERLYDIFSSLYQKEKFQGAAGVILDVRNGDVISLVSYPEYDSRILVKGGPVEIIKNYFQDNRKPFLNRAVSGLYSPGSTIKPIIALAALNEGIIDPNRKIFDSGSISIPNPYFPDKMSVFRDWKAHGWVDMEKAIAVSCDVYFYSIGGGYGDIKGLGVQKIDKYLRAFGLGKKTGIDLGGESSGLVPSPEDKRKVFGDVWRVGDTYNLSIGQGNLQVTPLQMARVAGAIANGGYLYKPHLLFGQTPVFKKINIEKKFFRVVQRGMRQAVLTGTAKALSDLPVDVAVKTGTAEIGSGKFVNSWVIAFWPYNQPRYALSIVLEKVRFSKELKGGVYVLHKLIEWMLKNASVYLTS